MKHRAVLPMQIAKYGTILISVFYFVLALKLLLNSSASITAIGSVLGGSFLVLGTVKLIGYFSKDLFRLAFQYDLLCGIFLVVLGLLILLKYPLQSQMLRLGYGISRIIDCLCKFKTTLDAKRFGINQWRIILILTVLSGLSGVALLISYRIENDFLFSAALFLEGILNVGVMLTMVKIIHHQQPDEPR